MGDLVPHRGRQLGQPRYPARPMSDALFQAARGAAARAVVRHVGNYAYKRYRNWYDQGQDQNPVRTSRRLNSKRSKGSVVESAQTGILRYTPKRRRGARRAGKFRRLEKRVATLARNTVPDSQRLVRRVAGGQIKSPVNVATHTNIEMWTAGTYEGSLDDLRTFDRAATPAPDTIDLRNSAFQTHVKYKDIVLRIETRNNNQVPCHFSVYWFKCTDNCATNPKSEAELLDQSLNLAFGTNPITYFSDVPKTFKTWKLLKTDKFKLNPGDECKSVYTQKSFKWDVKYRDLENTSYHPGDICCVLRCMGTIAHDIADTSIVGYGESGADYLIHKKYTLIYPSDIPVRDSDVDITGLGSLANAEVAGPSVDDEKNALQ